MRDSANRIRELRIARGWTQSQVARLSGVELSVVQRAEQGEMISEEHLESLARLLSTTTDDIRPGHASYLPRLESGKAIFDVVSGAYAYSFDHDSDLSDDDAELVADFLQEAHDWGELGDDTQPADRVKAAQSLNEGLTALEHAGYAVYGKSSYERVRGVPMPVARLLIRKLSIPPPTGGSVN